MPSAARAFPKSAESRTLPVEQPRSRHAQRASAASIAPACLRRLSDRNGTQWSSKAVERFAARLPNGVECREAERTESGPPAPTVCASRRTVQCRPRRASMSIVAGATVRRGALSVGALVRRREVPAAPASGDVAGTRRSTRSATWSRVVRSASAVLTMPPLPARRVARGRSWPRVWSPHVRPKLVPASEVGVESEAVATWERRSATLRAVLTSFRLPCRGATRRA